MKRPAQSRLARFVSPLALPLLLLACGTSDGTSEAGDSCSGEETRCTETSWQRCSGGAFVDAELCSGVCDSASGCLGCDPGTAICDGGTSRVCRADGLGYDIYECDPVQGLSCNEGSGQCEGACSPSALGRSYLGCDYYPTITANLLRPGLDFAVVIANSSSESANITIDGGSLSAPVTMSLEGGAVATQELPWNFDLKLCPIPDNVGVCNNPPDDGVFAAGGAFRVRSTQPVTVYQFNPLDYTNGQSFSYTNDASLLLPSNALGRDYTALAFPNTPKANNDYPSMVAITGTRDDTQVTISTRTSAGGGELGRFEANQERSISISRGDVLELLSGSGDLTGTKISAEHPVQVIAGHYAAPVALEGEFSDEDHLEEAMFPTQTLSTEYVVTSPALPSFPGGVSYRVRVMATAANTTVNVSPSVAGSPALLQSAGDFVDLELSADHVISANDRITVAHFILGTEFGGESIDDVGPSMSLSAPTDQYRSSYLFHAPTNYRQNYVNVVAEQGASVELDGQALSSFQSIGSSGFMAARVLLETEVGDGNHVISSDSQIGIKVYGYGEDTSYAYTGGLELEPISID